MNPNLGKLHPYPFERLAALKADARPPAKLAHISLAIGEPRHATPDVVRDALVANLAGLARYPATRGEETLRVAIADWLTRRYALAPGAVDPARQVLPVNGTREALFAFAQCIVHGGDDAVVVMPNPFYQIYEGAALLAGARPEFLNCSEADAFVPDLEAVPEAVWRRCQLLYLCSPGNPTGAVMGLAQLERVLELAERYDFVIASDECYSEIYPQESRPPPGLLQACARSGHRDFRRCVVFNSLSKRSNAPGLRSGFVAGDASILERFLLYRTYHGCAMPLPTQAASAAAWRDESHVVENRALYRRKFETVRRILSPLLPSALPEGGFFLWPRTPIDDQDFARGLFEAQNVTVLPGSYLSRPAHGTDPGRERVRIALVAPEDECVEAARRIVEFAETL